MGNQSLVKAEAKAALQAQRDAIKDREATVKNLQWSGKLTRAEKAVLYHACRAYGLDPALREIMVLGGNIYPTVAAMVRVAERSGDYGGCRFEELEPRPGDDFRYRCIVRKRVHDDWCDFEGLGRAAADKLNKVTREFADEMAQTRAKGRALRTAWPISLCSFEELPHAERAHAVEVTPEMLADFDPETGEELPPLREPGEEG